MNSLLIDTKCILADSRIRRTALSVRSAVQSSQLVEKTLSVAPSGVYTHTVLAGNKGTVIHVSKPVTVSLTLGVTVISFTLESSLVLTSPIAALSVTNPQTVAVDLFIIQC